MLKSRRSTLPSQFKSERRGIGQGAKSSGGIGSPGNGGNEMSRARNSRTERWVSSGEFPGAPGGVGVGEDAGEGEEAGAGK